MKPNNFNVDTSALIDLGLVSGSGGLGVGMGNPMTTEDDLIVGGASGVPARLGKGSDGDVLTVDPTTHHLVWAAPTGGSLALDDLTDVNAPAPADGDALVWDDGAGEWVAAAPSGVSDIVNIPTAETDTTLVLAPDGAGGVEWAAGGGGPALPGGVDGLWSWFKADAISGLSDGDSVPVWANSAQSGFDAVSIATQPIYKTNIVNSLPVVRFGGSTYYLALTPLWIASFTFYIVFKLSSIANAYTALAGDTTGGASGFFVKSTGKSALYVGNASNYDGTGSYTYGTTDWNYSGMIVSIGSGVTRRNGSADGSYSGGGVPADASFWRTWLLNETIGGRVFSGDVAEILIYPRALTSSEITSLESYLSTKYAL